MGQLYPIESQAQKTCHVLAFELTARARRGIIRKSEFPMQEDDNFMDECLNRAE